MSLGSRHEHASPAVRHPAAALARAAAHDAGRSRARSVELDPPSVVSGNRPVAAQPRHDRATGRASSHTAARPQHATARRRLRPGLSRADAGRARCRTRRHRQRARRASSLSGLRRRSALERGAVERGAAAALRRLFARSAVQAGQRHAPHPASGRHGPAHPELRGMARAFAWCAAPADRVARRSRAGGTSGGDCCLPSSVER